MYLNSADEILNTVLTIYAHNPEQPFPQSDEILMCTPHTTLDEVQKLFKYHNTLFYSICCRASWWCFVNKLIFNLVIHGNLFSNKRFHKRRCFIWFGNLWPKVEIFWRRAVFDTTDRLYCLVSGDLLDYEVSDRAERRLDYHMQKAQERGEL